MKIHVAYNEINLAEFPLMGGLIDTGKHTRNGGNPTKGRAGDIAKRTGRKDSPRAKFDLGKKKNIAETYIQR